MENGPQPEHRYSPFEVSRKALDEEYERLGFLETEELKYLREQAIEAAQLGEEEAIKAMLAGYQQQGEHLVSGLQGLKYMRGQIGLIIAKALVYRDIGNLAGFLNNVKVAKDYAHNAYEDDTVDVLERAPSIEIACILATLGEEYGFDAETIGEVATEPYDQAFQVAYVYLEQAGLNADEVLGAFIESNESSD